MRTRIFMEKHYPSTGWQHSTFCFLRALRRFLVSVKKADNSTNFRSWGDYRLQDIVTHSVETRTNPGWPVMLWFTRRWVKWRYLACASSLPKINGGYFPNIPRISIFTAISLYFWIPLIVCVSIVRRGRAIAQAVSRRLPTAAARVQTRVWSCGILWWTKVALG
jgi:hypothetical protein